MAVKFLVDMRTCPDGATREAIAELRSVVTALREDLDTLADALPNTVKRVVKTELAAGAQPQASQARKPAGRGKAKAEAEASADAASDTGAGTPS